MSTTWKQVVLDTADAYREANGTTDKIPVGQLADKVRAGAGTPYEGDNPLTIGSEGYTFPAKTLLKDGLQIVNGVNGEDLTQPLATQEVAVADLLTMVGRKLADHKGEGQFVWKKLTAEGGDFIDYVVSSDAEAYPDGAVHTDGYYYEIYEAPSLEELTADATATAAQILEGYTAYAKGEKLTGEFIGLALSLFQCTKYAIDTFTPASDISLARYETYTINYTLGQMPKFVLMLASQTNSADNYGVYGGFIFTYNGSTKTNVGWYSRNGNVSEDNGAGLAINASTLVLSYTSGSTCHVMGGVTYTVITMA